MKFQDKCVIGKCCYFHFYINNHHEAPLIINYEVAYSWEQGMLSYFLVDQLLASCYITTTTTTKIPQNRSGLEL